MYKTGDFVVVKEGFNADHNSEFYGGAGYDELPKNERLEVTVIIRNTNGKSAYFFKNFQDGVYEFTLRTKAEMRNDILSELLNDGNV